MNEKINPSALNEASLPVKIPGFSTAGLLSALPDFGFAGAFLLTWVDPYAFGQKMISYLMLIMLMEFIILHSSAFMGSVMVSDTTRLKKSLSLIGLGVFYTLFVGGFALSFKEWWPLWAFWGMMGNRLLGVLIGQAPTGKEKNLIVSSWAAGVLFYLLFVFATTILPVPAFGITAEVIRAQQLPGSGLWIDEPYRVIAFGFFYFTTVALSEMFGHSWMGKVQGQGRSG